MRDALLFVFILALSRGDADIFNFSTEYNALFDNYADLNSTYDDAFHSDRNTNSADSNNNLHSTRKCPDEKLLATKYSNKTNTSSTSDHISTSATNLDLEMSKTDSLAMKEFLKKYKQLNNTNTEGCFNDSKCVYFGDCCPYKNQYFLEKTYNSYKCLPIKKSPFSVGNYLLVSKCLPYFKSDVDTRKKCEQDSGHKYPPVISNGVGRFYRNKYCAICNNDWNFTEWITEIFIDNLNWFDEIARIRYSSDATEFMKKYNRNAIFNVPVGMKAPWGCDIQYSYIDTCNRTGELLIIEPWEEFGCRSYTDPVGYYRNAFCKSCNERMCLNLAQYMSMVVMPDAKSLKNDEERYIEKLNEDLCKAEEFYDYSKKRCRRIECSFGFYLDHNSTCSRIPILIKQITYKIHFSLILLMKHIEKDTETIKYNVLFTGQSMLQLTPSLVTFKYQLTNQTDQPPLVEKVLFYIHVNRTGPETFARMEKNIESFISGIKKTHFPPGSRIIKDFESLKISEDYFRGKLPDKFLYKSELLQILPHSSINRSILYSKIRECPKVRLSTDEFTLDENKSQIIINVRLKNVSMNRVEFYPNGTAMICLSDYPGTFSILEPLAVDFIEIVLTKVFISISLVCLVLTLTTYAIFPGLRTLPGKCNIFLCCTLFLAQALCINTSFDDDMTCMIIGAIRHFVWLSTFGWMSVCSFHMYRVFTRLLVSKDTKTNKTITIYALIAYGFPLPVVVGTITTNMVLYGVTVTGYGLPNCFLGKRLQLILAFILPLALMIIFNASLLSITIYSLYKTSNECKIVNQDRHRVIVYLKLSSLTGITWVFGFLSMLIPNKWFTYLFIITNASQGIYIFLSYTFNSNVLKLFNEKFARFRSLNKRRRYANAVTIKTTDV